MNKDYFPHEVSEAIGFYVYRLVDPRNAETFYIGKGKGNRVFQHAANTMHSQTKEEGSLKIQRIREIQAEGLEVISIIHRYGMEENVAFTVEAALIDAYPGLTNLVKGHASDYGIAAAQQILRRYAAEKIYYQHKVMEVLVKFVGAGQELYDQTRFAWKASRKSAESCSYILAVRNGIVQEVYTADQWVSASDPALGALADENLGGRLAFIGRTAEQRIRALYHGKAVEPRPAGAANPIRYRSPENNIPKS